MTPSEARFHEKNRRTHPQAVCMQEFACVREAGHPGRHMQEDLQAYWADWECAE